MTWYAFLTLLAKLVYSLTTYVQERKLLSAGEATAVAEGLKRAADALAIAHQVDIDADAKHQADPTDTAFDQDFKRD